MTDISQWLEGLGLGKYAGAFADNDVDFEVLTELSEAELETLGLPLGARKKLMKALRDLGPRDSSSALPLRASSDRAQQPEVERRQLTVMFCDLVGSTALSQQLDPEDYRKVITSFQKAVSDAVRRFDGHVAKYLGDGLLAYFGYPQAHEDDAERAVRAGLASLAAVHELEPRRGAKLDARVGIATGLVVAGDVAEEGVAEQGAIAGETPNLAARLQSAAEPGGVVVSQGTHKLIGELFDCEDLGPQALKGIAAAEYAWRVIRERQAESRFDARHGAGLTPFVGRVDEIDLLLRRWERAKRGEGQIVLISGEAGLGKSRLTQHVRERLVKEPHTRLNYQCSPHHINSALYPMSTQLVFAAGIAADDPASIKLDKLEALLGRGTDDVSGVAPLFADLLSIPHDGRFTALNLTPQAQKVRTLHALNDQLIGLARKRPVLVLFEDLHWIDPTTQELLDLMVDRIEAAPILVLMTFRPEYQAKWIGQPYVALIALSRLTKRQCAEMARNVAAEAALSAAALDEIVAKTEGVPLFVEEVTRAHLESDAADAIPSTIQASLRARLDRLGPAKEVAQIGAVIGREFDYRLLEAVAPLDTDTLRDALERLVKSELVFQRGAPPDATYTFKHALVQDAASESLLKTKRRTLHAEIAAALRTLRPLLEVSQPELLAHHYTAAGLVEQAGAFWLKAGQNALKRSANREAAAHLGRGLELAAALPDSESRMRQELQLQTAMGVAMMAVKGWGAPEVEQAYTKARTLSEKLGDKGQLFAALRGEGQYHMISGHLHAADELGRQCMELARASGDSAFLLEAHHLLWANKFFMGDYAASESHADLGIACYDPDRHHSLTYIYSGHDPGVCCRGFSSITLWLRGYPDQALERCREALALAERESHPLTMTVALWAFSYVHLMRREPEKGRGLAEKEIALAKEHFLPLMHSQGAFQLGWALADQGHVREGISQMRNGIAAITATGADMGMPYLLSILARACAEAGGAQEGLHILEKAFRIVADAGAQFQLPEVLRAKGELLLRLNPRDNAAEGWIRQAVTTARDQGAKSAELRAALSLAQLHRARGHDDQARDLLAPIYGWFTEGFDTPDLKEAKALLAELS